MASLELTKGSAKIISFTNKATLWGAIFSIVQILCSGTAAAVNYSPNPGYPLIDCTNPAAIHAQGPGDIWTCPGTAALYTFNRNGAGTCGLEWGDRRPGWQGIGAYYS